MYLMQKKACQMKFYIYFGAKCILELLLVALVGDVYCIIQNFIWQAFSALNTYNTKATSKGSDQTVCMRRLI